MFKVRILCFLPYLGQQNTKKRRIQTTALIWFWSTSLCKCKITSLKSLFHLKVPRTRRSSVWKRQRGVVLSCRGWGRRWREQRSRARLRSLRVRSMNWGNSSSRYTTNWELPRTESTRHNTSWSGELCRNTYTHYYCSHSCFKLQFLSDIESHAK